MAFPPIPEKYKLIRLAEEERKSIKKSFYFLVRKVYHSQYRYTYLGFNQLGNLAFNDKDSLCLKQIFTEYKEYLINSGLKRKINYEKLYIEHPGIWGISTIASDPLVEIANSLSDEYNAVKDDEKHTRFKIRNLKLVSNHGGIFIFTAETLLDRDENIFIPEGLKVKYLDYHFITYVIVLEFNIAKELIVFQTNVQLYPKNTTQIIQFSFAELLSNLRAFICSLKQGDGPVWQIFQNKRPQETENIFSWHDPLDPSQKSCLEKSLSHSYTFIWGPPGTGKSHTLARILLNCFISGERTLVCSLANVAVDQLVEKTLDLLQIYKEQSKVDLLKKKKIIRYGYNQSSKLRNIPELQASNREIEHLAIEIEEIENRLKEETISENEKYQIKSDLNELKRKHDKALKEFLAESKILFLTNSKFLIENSIHEMEFDNLVIDEGSMMSIPYLLLVGNKIKNRIIIAGDTKQLGPIALSHSELSQKWLHNDLFSLLKTDKLSEHVAVSMLQEQRRCAKEIAELINHQFYEGKLRTINTDQHKSLFSLPPLKGEINFINLLGNENSIVEYSESQSRYNKYSRKKVFEVLEQIIDDRPDLKIGIITPYRQQVNDYKSAFLFNERRYENITVGTIHTFQGSERDVIIWDIVDARNQPIGLIYHRENGERLVNVAISRAKYKLIIVGDCRILHEGDKCDLVTYKVKRILQDAYDFSISNNYINNR